MALCDICAAEAVGRRVSAARLREAVAKGFDPVRLRLLPAAASSEAGARAMWDTLVSQDQTDWNVCDGCMVHLGPYLGSSPDRGREPPPPSDALLDGVWIVMGPQREALIRELRTGEDDPPIVSVRRAAELGLPRGHIYRCQFFFAFDIPGRAGKRVGQAELKEWAQRLLGELRFLPEAEPKVSAAQNKTGDGMILALFWTRGVDSSVCHYVARSLEKAYLAGGGEAPGPAAEAEPPAAEGSRSCPFCAETVRAEAVFCRFCRSDISPGICLDCRKRNRREARFCGFCGGERLVGRAGG